MGKIALCKLCGEEFKKTGKFVYCSPECQKKAKNKKSEESRKKSLENAGQLKPRLYFGGKTRGEITFEDINCGKEDVDKDCLSCPIKDKNCKVMAIVFGRVSFGTSDVACHYSNRGDFV
jgi:hypothetical protein